MNKRQQLLILIIISLAVLCICVGWIIGHCLPSKIVSVACTDSINVARETKYSEVLTDDVVLQLEDSCLMLYIEDDSQCLIEDTAAFCWDGSHILYLDEASGSVYAVDSQMPSALFTLAQENVTDTYFMLASDKWIVLRGWESLHIFHRETSTLRSLSLRSDINGSDAFICENKLICVGGAEELFTIMDLTSGVIDTIDVGINSIECVTTASCAYDGVKVYLSVRVRSWPNLGIKLQNGTYAINLTDLQIETLSDKYYETLFFKDNGLYGEKGDKRQTNY